MSSLVPVTGGRVSNHLRVMTVLENVSDIAMRLLREQEALSSGRAIRTPSVDPIGASLAMGFQNLIEHKEQYLSNVNAAVNFLDVTDQALGELNDLIIQARTIGLGEIGDSANATTREASGEQIQSILGQCIALANRQYDRRYIFGGSLSGTAPCVATGGGVAFLGNSDDILVNVDTSLSLPINVSGVDLFGAHTAEVVGTVDLDPTVTADTLLADLNGGTGVPAGEITVSDGFFTMTVDLTDARTIGDVMGRINNAFPPGSVTAALNATADGITLSSAIPGANITVVDASGSGTAVALGIASPPPGAGPLLVGLDVNPALSLFNQVGQLAAGAGVDLASGVVITNGAYWATVTFGAATTVQDIINAINSSQTYVSARVNDARTGIEVRSCLSGGTFQITENGGTTGADLGILTSGAVRTDGLFDHLVRLRNAMSANDSEEISLMTDALENDLHRLLAVRSDVGARVQQVQVIRDRIDAELVETRMYLSNVMDIDFAETIAEFRMLQATFEASLNVASRVLQLSMLDFM